MYSRTEFTDIYADDEMIERVTEVMQSGRFVKGRECVQFENEFASAVGANHAIGVSNGTAALLLALQAHGVGPGDEVFIPAHTFFATASPVAHLGAQPVFVDIDPETYTIDVDDVESKIAESTTPAAIMPVHIYGQMADMRAITKIATDHDLVVIEDACQAHMATREGQTAGTAGDVGCFSFYPSKNMTVGGDGGMIVTDDAHIADHIRALRNHGRGEDGIHRHLGLNHRLDETNAAVGRVQLEHIERWSIQRNDAAQRYTDQLTEIPEVTVPTEVSDAFHVYHLYVIQAPDRDDLRAHLDARGIDTGIHYATPAHVHPAMRAVVGEVHLPVAEALCDRIVSLPMHPRIEPDAIDRVCSEIAAYYT
jgi:dTDP-4-amino-4,6-dideoxygalactose transaminase